MKTLVAAFITALLVFTLATLWIDVVKPRLETLGFDAAPQHVGSRVSVSNRRSPRRMIETDVAEVDSDDEDRTPVQKDLRTKSRARDKNEKSAKDSQRLIAQLEQIKQEEAKLIEREKMLKMLYDDIFKIVETEEANRNRSAAELDLVEQRVLEASLLNPGIAPVSSESAYSPALPVVAKIRKFDAESRIAEMVHNLAKRGSSSAAAVMLSGLKDRESAKVLSLVNTRDPKLAIRLSHQVQAARQDLIQRF